MMLIVDSQQGTQLNNTHQITINQREYSSIAEGLDNAISLDYHYARGYIYWTDVTLDAIKRAYLNGSGEIGKCDRKVRQVKW